MKKILVFSALSSIFVLSQFYRASAALISPTLMKEFQIGAEKLGLLGAFFFYAFAISQIPMGVFLDRWGPRVVMTVLSAIGAFGAFFFAAAQNYTTLLIGRALLGIGMSSALMGSLKVFVISLPPERFATFSGFLLSIGTLGNIVASSPLAYLHSTIGWRKTFALFGIFTFIISILLWVSLKDIGKKEDKKPEKELNVKDLLETILRTPSFWQVATLAFFRYGTFVAMQGLWFGPYLILVKGFDPHRAGNILMMLSFGLILGSSLAGYLADHVFLSPKKAVLFGVSLYAFSIIFFVGVFEIKNPLYFYVIFLLIGIFNSFGILIYAHIKSLFSSEVSGTVMSCVNFFTMAGGAFFMHVMGSIINLYRDPHGGYPAHAYHKAFGICLLGLVLSLIIYSFSKEKKENKCHDDI